jgi:peptidoglycan/LPS O-acetylase OafA/YrhL
VAVETAPRAVPTTARHHEIDRLRILAVLLLFPFHAARVFDTASTWYVKNDESSEVLTWGVVRFLDPWHMPLLFVLAGMATWYALRHRTARAYVRERSARLLLPFVVGVLVIVPPQPFLAQLPDPGGETSYAAFLGGYFTDVTDLTGYDGGFTPAHLWFILYLFAFSLVGVGLFGAIRRRAIDHDIGRPWMLVVTPFAFLVAEALPAPDGVWSPFTTFVMFVGGFVLASSQRLLDTVGRAWRWLLAAGAVSMAAVFTVWASDAPVEDSALADAAFQLLESTNTWLWVLASIGAAAAWLARPPTPLLRSANEAAYPVYILHQTVIVAIGYAVVRWEIGLPLKYLAILVGSFVVTVVLYELAIRRWRTVRPLFGLKPVR